MTTSSLMVKCYSTNVEQQAL